MRARAHTHTHTHTHTRAHAHTHTHTTYTIQTHTHTHTHASLHVYNPSKQISKKKNSTFPWVAVTFKGQKRANRSHGPFFRDGGGCVLFFEHFFFPTKDTNCSSLMFFFFVYAHTYSCIYIYINIFTYIYTECNYLFRIVQGSYDLYEVFFFIFFYLHRM